MNKKELMEECEKLIDEKLKEKEEEFVINTKTHEEYDELMQILEDRNYKYMWTTGDKPTKSDLWGIYKICTCIRLRKDKKLEFSNKYFYERHTDEYGEIISVDEYKKKIGYKPKAKAGSFINIGYGTLGLVVNKANWGSECCKGDLAVVLLNTAYDNGFQLAEGFQEAFEEGKYKIIPKEEALERLK